MADRNYKMKSQNPQLLKEIKRNLEKVNEDSFYGQYKITQTMCWEPKGTMGYYQFAIAKSYETLAVIQVGLNTITHGYHATIKMLSGEGTTTEIMEICEFVKEFGKTSNPLPR